MAKLMIRLVKTKHIALVKEQQIMLEEQDII